MSKIILSLILVLIAQPLWGFDGAGKNTKEPSNPEILTVTTLADSGPGSLREKLDIVESANSKTTPCNTSNAYHIEFAVSGTIFGQSPLVLRDSSCLVMDGAGQVTIDGSQLLMRDTKHIIIRHMRSEDSPTDGFTLWNCDKCVLTNISCRDAEDECVGIVDGAQEVTFGDSIISYKDSGARKAVIVSRFKVGGVVGPATQPVSVIRNIMHNQIDRQPLVKGEKLKSTFISNNIIWEWGMGTSGGNGTRIDSANGNIRNNLYYKLTGNHEDDAMGYSPVALEDNMTFYFDGNVAIGPGQEIDINDPPCPAGVTCTPLSNPVGPGTYHITLADAEELPCLLAVTAGARPLDAHDQAIVDELCPPMP